jgi:KDO2-lipid IV(A) lauroyltransferase
MRQRSAIRNGYEYLLALAAIKSLEWTPLPIARHLARIYSRLLDLAIPRLRRVAEQNLELALPNEDSSRIIDGVFASIARLLVAFAKFPSIRTENLHRWVRCEGMEHVEAAYRAGRGVLFATAHFGNWELSAYAHALFTAPMNVVVRPLDNPLLDRFVERRRTASGNRLISKKDYARSILKALAANEAVGILIDQNASLESGTFVNFFGVPACAGTGFARLAAHSGAAVIPGFALWSEKEGRYILRFHPPVPITGDVEADTEALQDTLESAIRACPEQWLWIHRRWKTRPPGSRPLYAMVPGVHRGP